MKLLFALLFFISSLSLGAQTTFTGHLRAAEQGKGVVVIIQSDEIEQAVNRKKTVTAASSAKETKTSTAQTAQKHTPEPSKTTPKQSHTADSAKKNHAETEKAGHLAETSSEHSTAGASRHYTERARRKAQGYRICIYTGGNSRADREKAVKMGNKCRAKFSELASYPNFIAPRWVTYVGDFRTREEAQKYVTRIRKANISYEVRIVKSEVNLPY